MADLPIDPTVVLAIRSSELGRHARNLRFYLWQADLNGKLAMAARLWLQSSLHMAEP